MEAGQRYPVLDFNNKLRKSKNLILIHNTLDSFDNISKEIVLASNKLGKSEDNKNKSPVTI